MTGAASSAVVYDILLLLYLVLAGIDRIGVRYLVEALVEFERVENFIFNTLINNESQIGVK